LNDSPDFSAIIQINFIHYSAIQIDKVYNQFWNKKDPIFIGVQVHPEVFKTTPVFNWKYWLMGYPEPSHVMKAEVEDGFFWLCVSLCASEKLQNTELTEVWKVAFTIKHYTLNWNIVKVSS
jgi:hypothetical protein